MNASLNKSSVRPTDKQILLKRFIVTDKSDEKRKSVYFEIELKSNQIYFLGGRVRFPREEDEEGESERKKIKESSR